MSNPEFLPYERRRIVERFEAWLERTLAAETAPSGLAAEVLAVLGHVESADAPGEAGDLYAMWAALTAATQEVKLQGRAFKQLRDALTPGEEDSGALDALMSEQRETLAETRRLADLTRAERRQNEERVRQETERSTRREMLDLLLDLRERLGRGARSAREAARKPAPKPPWFLRPFVRSSPSRLPNETVAAFAEGYELTIERLDEALGEFGVREIEAEDRLFDPRLMNAVEIVQDPDCEDGTVLEVLRAGYMWNGELLRAALVKVARRAG